MMENVFGYAAPVWRRFVAPAGVGRLDGPDCRQVIVGSPAAAAQLAVSIRCVDGRILEARFQALGCPVTVAVGQWLTEVLTGQRWPPPTDGVATACRAALEIGADKAHCGLMAEDVVRAMARLAEETS